MQSSFFMAGICFEDIDNAMRNGEEAQSVGMDESWLCPLRF